MAKKRVHEIAKERGISSKEVLAVLQKAGFDVKASASSVDENDIALAFNGKKKEPASKKEAEPAQRGTTRPIGSQQGQPGAPPPPPANSAAGGQSSQGGDRPQRPTRGAPARPGSGGRRRRVGIDSQAS